MLHLLGFGRFNYYMVCYKKITRPFYDYNLKALKFKHNIKHLIQNGFEFRIDKWETEKLLRILDDSFV